MKKLGKLTLKEIEKEIPVLKHTDQINLTGGSGCGYNTLNTNGQSFIKSWESLSLVQYDDNGNNPGGNMTIGYGHVIQEGENFENGITSSFADELFICDAEWAISHVNSVVSVPLTQNQFDALVSYVFNTGFLTNTQLLQNLNNGDYDGAACEMDIVTSGGVYMEGLANRRIAEQELFLDD